ncbi:TetR/AcrR family transcriptional regulator [Streptomyces afghaniensis]|uniref:TetR/AcrR family transcriptional regulator n=1 Tax=Streptomyces afghaniensis TaxID=66865 RepID=UPI002788C8EC|nr:TetR/AcrR family transcriptional regulator [Streptomyces afghaniensis]MDQ1021910.1 AcrR family transcriptional regulator [Streptomyces afghaniensis]
MGNDAAAGADEDGRHGGLSRQRVLAAALDLVDREGLSALTMRRLGTELGVEAMSLYRYAPGKTALLDGVVEALFLQLEDRLAQEWETAAHPDTAGPGWRAELQRIALITYQVCLDHPESATLIFTRMTEVPLARWAPAVLRDHERVLGVLWDAGFAEARAAPVLRAITAWVFGYVSVDLRAMVDNPDEPDPAFRLGLYRMPFQDLPRLRATAPALAEQGGPEGLAAGLDALLDHLTGGQG